MRDTGAGQRGRTVTDLSMGEVITMPHPGLAIESGDAQPHRPGFDTPVAEHVEGEAGGLGALVVATGAGTAQSGESRARLQQVPYARTARHGLNRDQVLVTVCSHRDRPRGGSRL